LCGFNIGTELLQLGCDTETLSDNTRTAASVVGDLGFAIVSPPSPGAIVARVPLIQGLSPAGFAPAISRNGANAAWAEEAVAAHLDTIVVYDPSLIGGVGRFTLPSTVSRHLSGVSINDLANTAFVRQATDSTTRPLVGAVTTQSGSLGLITVADTTSGLFSNFWEVPSINNLNEVAFAASPANVDITNGTSFPNVGDISGRAPTLVAGPGEVIAADGTTFLHIRANGLLAQSMNDKGQIAFYGLINRPGTGPNSGTRFAVLRADPAPGVSPGNPIIPGPGDEVPGGGWRFIPCRGASWSPVPVRECPPEVVYIDPDLAVGYTYTVEGSGPNFKSVQIPAPLPNGDATFQVEFDGRTAALIAGQRFDLSMIVPGGVKTFRITGIDTAEALGPTNARAFVTGLSFMDPSILNFTVTMVPIVENPGDTDRDGVPNGSDTCPNTALGVAVDANGCSAAQRDSDGDGVKDNVDLCPGTAPGSQVNANGCSEAQIDSDGDGVPNSVDLCPNTAPFAAVNSSGCSAAQRDLDGDGVPDSIDACPSTPANTVVDAVGCPVVRPARVCDVNGDTLVNYRDIKAIMQSLGKKATGASDPRDANRDGKITIVDAAICTSKCDRWLCR
jgi:hypothetical protein